MPRVKRGLAWGLVVITSAWLLYISYLTIVQFEVGRAIAVVMTIVLISVFVKKIKP